VCQGVGLSRQAWLYHVVVEMKNIQRAPKPTFCRSIVFVTQTSHKLWVPGPSAQVLWAKRLRTSLKLVYQATLGLISMSQVTGRAQLLRAPGVPRTGQAPLRRVFASARSPHSVSHVNRRAALIAAGLISTVQALAAEEKPTSEKYATGYILPDCKRLSPSSSRVRKLLLATAKALANHMCCMQVCRRNPTTRRPGTPTVPAHDGRDRSAR